MSVKIRGDRFFELMLVCFALSGCWPWGNSNENPVDGTTYALPPHDASFSQPATISIPFDADRIPAGIDYSSEDLNRNTLRASFASGATVSLHEIPAAVPVQVMTSNGRAVEDGVAPGPVRP